MKSYHKLISFRVFCTIIACLPLQLIAQQPVVAPPAVRAILPADSSHAYVYHTLMVPAGHGVLLYRTVAGGEEELLDSVPLMLSFDPATILKRAGQSWDDLARATRRNDPLSAVIALRQNPGNANLLTYLSPQIADVLVRRFVDHNPVIGKPVLYRVEVVDDLAEPIGMEISGTVTLSPVRPQAPHQLMAQSQGFSVGLEWQYPAVDPNRDDAVLTFQPECVVRNGNETTEVIPTPVLRTMGTKSFSTIIPVQESGSEVTCRVTAVTFAGTPGVPSEEVSVVFVSTIPLPIVNNPEVKQTGGFSVEINWAIPEDTRVEGFHLYRSTTGSDGFERLTTFPLPKDQASYTDKVPRDGMSWFYAVSVVSGGVEGEMSQPGFTIVRDITPPSTPVNFFVKPQDKNTVLLQWEDPSPAPDLWSYILLRVRDSRGAGSAWTQINPGNDLRETSFLDSGESARGFSEGSFYRYALVAIDSTRNRSDTLFARIQIPDDTPPQAPPSLSATQPDGFRVSLAWNASIDGDVVLYHIYKSSGPSGPGSFEKLAAVSYNVQTYRDEKVTPGETYHYHVTAIDSVGNESVPSQLASLLVRPAAPPADVRNIRVEPTDNNSSVLVTWEPVRSQYLAGYRIYRSATSTGVYEPVGETSKEQTSWTDNATEGRHWWYKVYSIDVAGTRSRLSDVARMHGQ